MRKEYIVVGLLFILALVMRLYMAHIDPFLHDWDERFHALVARNMMDHPFKPMLRNNPIFSYDFMRWDKNHIWLHKQPLFLWQMALSMKCFGVSEFAIRLPSALLGALSVPLVYRITKLLTNEMSTSFIAALLMCFSYYQLELISGFKGMEHNDIAFHFYILASFWAYAEFVKVKKWQWAMLIGLFVGCAILCKWLVGLLVFSVWGLNIIINFIKTKKLPEWSYYLSAVGVCILTFLPWQLYIIHTFPVEAKYEYAYNTQHISQAVEGHEGSMWYYFERMNQYFGDNISCLVLLGLLLLLFLKKKTGYEIKLALIAAFGIVFCFFSFFVKSKLPSYFFIVVPFGFIFMAFAITSLLELITKKWYWYLVIMIPILFLSLRYQEIGKERSSKNEFRNSKVHNTKIYKNFKSLVNYQGEVVLNLNTLQDIEFMFYNNDIAAYDHKVEELEFEKCKERNLKFIAFKDHGEFVMPAYYKRLPNFEYIDLELK